MEVRGMLVLITYDVSTETAAGRKRLRQIAKACVNYGQRVQNSVFECSLDAAQYRKLQARLLELMDKEKDSLRFYNLGNNYQARIEHFGRDPGYDPEGVLVL
jgi:CRISPR-associated protein Cas2